MSLWDGKDKDVASRSCLFQDELCKGLPSVRGMWFISEYRVG